MDYNATSPLRPEAGDAMMRAMEQPHNASAVHSYGREGRKLVEAARKNVATLTGAPETQIIFNSGATEGNNTVLQFFSGQRILISSIEHPSVLEATKNPTLIPVTTDGTVDLDALETLLKKEKTALVSVMLVNNETGIIQPITEVSALAKRHGALLHCDAVQAVGHIPIDITTLGVDFLTISSHKMGGPQGVGALILGLCGITPTLLHGGRQEKQARAGTENVAGIAGFGTAAELALQSLANVEKLKQLRTSLETGLCAINNDTTIHGHNVPRAASTCLFSAPGINAKSLLISLDLDGIAVSNGAACSSGTVKSGHVLKAMGASEEEAGSALRISLGWATKQSDIDGFLESWETICTRIQNKAA